MLNPFSSKHNLIRPTDALLPLAFLIGAALDRSDVTLTVFVCLMASRLLGLASPVALRAAFALQPSMRKVRGSVKVAALLQLAGAALALGVWALWFRDRAAIPLILLTAWLLNTEHVLYEYLYAAGESQSAMLSRLLTATLTGAGLSVAALTGNIYGLIVCAVISAIVSAVIGLSIGGGLKGSLNARVFRTAPLSMLREALYPACALGLWWLFWADLPSAAPIFVGWVLYALYQTPFRRSYMESEPMKIVCLLSMFVAATVFALTLIRPLAAAVGPVGTRIAAACAVMLALAVACAYVLNGSFKKDRD